MIPPPPPFLLLLLLLLLSIFFSLLGIWLLVVAVVVPTVVHTEGAQFVISFAAKGGRENNVSWLRLFKAQVEISRLLQRALKSIRDKLSLLAV